MRCGAVSAMHDNHPRQDPKSKRDVFELLENLGRQPLIKRKILRRGCPSVVRCLIGKEKFHSLMGILNMNLIVQVIERSFKK
uniref:Uncharacterized protein n=1 Tax=Oryza nivara TaxID=4536 RepID=A0A0E0GQB9_ORYNI